MTDQSVFTTMLSVSLGGFGLSMGGLIDARRDRDPNADTRSELLNQARREADDVAKFARQLDPTIFVAPPGITPEQWIGQLLSDADEAAELLFVYGNPAWDGRSDDNDHERLLEVRKQLSTKRRWLKSTQVKSDAVAMSAEPAASPIRKATVDELVRRAMESNPAEAGEWSAQQFATRIGRSKSAVAASEPYRTLEKSRKLARVARQAEAGMQSDRRRRMKPRPR